MTKLQVESEAKLRILNTARDLFYRQGYRATGINEIIKKSGVAKATFYSHFPSKESLALAYVKSMNADELLALEAGLEQYPGPYEKLLGLIKFLIPYSVEKDYRGCAYLNLSAEVTDHSNPLRMEIKSHYRAVRELIGKLIGELKTIRGHAWKDRHSAKMADDFMLIFCGAIALGQIYHDVEPFHQAIEAARRLLE